MQVFIAVEFRKAKKRFAGATDLDFFRAWVLEGQLAAEQEAERLWKALVVKMGSTPKALLLVASVLGLMKRKP
jgi:hypothetical protein